MMIQTIGFEATDMDTLVNKINTWFATNPRANGVEYVDTKYSCTGSIHDIGGLFANNMYKYTALVIVKVR